MAPAVTVDAATRTNVKSVQVKASFVNPLAGEPGTDRSRQAQRSRLTRVIALMATTWSQHMMRPSGSSGRQRGLVLVTTAAAADVVTLLAIGMFRSLRPG